jgi:FAD/FMN-containing dehydrogenase
VSFDGGTHDPAKFDEVREWVRATIEAARQLNGAGGAYLNFSGDDGTDERVLQQQFGGNLDRLRAIKKQYDPDNLFRINNNIKPADVTPPLQV